MLLFGLLMVFVGAGLSQFFGFAAIAFDDIELPDDMLFPDIVLLDIVFAAALVQLCLAPMVLWPVIALPLDMELLLDIELPCAKAWPPISIAAAAVTIRIRDMKSSGLRFSQVRKAAPTPDRRSQARVQRSLRYEARLRYIHKRLRGDYFSDNASVTILPSTGWPGFSPISDITVG